MDYLLLLSVFVASTVEYIEALTIILAIGVSRGWRAALIATATAIASLSAVIIIFAPVIANISEESDGTLRHIWLVAGSLLLIFGLQWMRKGILRFAGIIPTHDEAKVYKQVQADAAKSDQAKGDFDWYAFAIVFKAVWLEGLEVVFIVVAVAANGSSLATATLGALLALVAVTITGALVHRPLSRVPENPMKFAVGVLLSSFGTYFTVKGLGIMWPHGETALAFITAFYLIAGLCLISAALHWAHTKRPIGVRP